MAMFVSGREALASVENAIGKVRSNEQQLDTVLRSAADEAERRRKQLAEAYRALALVRLDAMMRNDVVGELDAAERRAMELLRTHKARLDQMLIRHAGLTQKVRDAEAEHREKTEAVERAGEPIAKLVAEVDKQLPADSAWNAQHMKAEMAARVAEAAHEKASQAEADREAKRKPYESDPLFSYLWQRGFGTGAYSADNFTRSMDRWVARLIDYNTARPNYTMLLEIPMRLREHANRTRKVLDDENEVLRKIARRALEAAGVKPLEDELTKQQAALAAATKRLSDAQGELNKLDAERRELIENGDRNAHDQALDVLVQAIARDDIQTLYREALATKTGEDDKLVQWIEESQRAINKAEAEVTRIRDEAREIARRRGELEGVRDKFRRRRYDDPWTEFEIERGNTVDDLIAGILRGALQGAVLWNVFEHAHRRNIEWDSGIWIGGGGFPGRSMPRMRLPGSSFPGGFGGMGRGGGFRTGGRF